jgi:putative FmdB family regulatory protein
VPLYEYACGDCGTRFERLLSFTRASADLTCPDCGARDVRRLPSVFAALNRGDTALPMMSGAGCGCAHGGGCGCAN